MSKSTNKMKKRYADDERADEDLAQSMSQLSLDRAYECPQWLHDYARYAGCSGELKEILRYTFINESLHNIMTALKNAFRISELENYFATDESVEKIDERTTFADVFNDACYPHKINSYVFVCTSNEYVTAQIQRCVEYLEKVCEMMDLDQLFVFLDVFAKLRLEPFTNPIVMTIYKRLDALPTPEEKLKALNRSPAEAAEWQRIPQQRVSTRREIYWTFAARQEQDKQFERIKHTRNKEKLLAIYATRPVTNEIVDDNDSVENNADDSGGRYDEEDDCNAVDDD